MIEGLAATPLPPGTRLLHIGPHKTGTTALQGAFHGHRRELEAQGVHYAGPNRQPMQAAHAITGKASPYAGGKAPPRRRWDELVREVRGAGTKRVVISSEGFADADDDGIRRVVRDLEPGRIHVVVTLRPLARLLASQWQQYVQGGMTIAYEPWLEAVLADPPGDVSPTFWHRHRHDRLIDRWAAAAGPGIVTVVVADEADRSAVIRAFEGLTGLRPGTLTAEPDLANRSLTLAEVETVRTFNVAFREAGLGTQLHTKVMRLGAAEHLKRRRPAPGEPGISTPAWALGRAEKIQREIVAGIEASGVRVIGDLATLLAAGGTAAGPGSEARAATPTPDEAWADVGARTAMGVLLASGLARGGASTAGERAWPDGPPPAGARRRPSAQVEPIELARLSTPLLGFIVFKRLVAAALSWLRLR